MMAHGPSGGGQPAPGSACIPTSAPQPALAGSAGDGFAGLERNFCDTL